MPMSRPSARAVLWDLDGTLVDSETVHQAALEQLLAEIGCAAPPDMHAVLIGKSIDEVHVFLRDRADLRLSLEEFTRRRGAIYVGLSSALKLRPGAVETVTELAAAGVPQAIVSNSERLIVDINLEATRLDRLGLRSISRTDVDHPKPHPEPYRTAAALLGIDPSLCVVVEDSPTGALAGLAAGAAVIAWPEPGVTLAFDAAATLVETADGLRRALASHGLPIWAPA